MIQSYMMILKKYLTRNSRLIDLMTIIVKLRNYIMNFSSFYEVILFVKSKNSLLLTMSFLDLE